MKKGMATETPVDTGVGQGTADEKPMRVFIGLKGKESPFHFSATKGYCWKQGGKYGAQVLMFNDTEILRLSENSVAYGQFREFLEWHRDEIEGREFRATFSGHMSRNDQEYWSLVDIAVGKLLPVFEGTNRGEKTTISKLEDWC